MNLLPKTRGQRPGPVSFLSLLPPYPPPSLHLPPPGFCEQNLSRIPMVIWVASRPKALCRSLALGLPVSVPLTNSDLGHLLISPQTHQCAKTLLSPVSGSTRREGAFRTYAYVFPSEVSMGGSLQSGGSPSADQRQKHKTERSLLFSTMSLKTRPGWAVSGDSRRLNVFSF